MGTPKGTAVHHNGTRHREYSKQTQSVIAEYREENKRLRLRNADMLDALIQIRAVRAVRSELASGHIQHVIDILDSIVALADSAISKAEGRDA